MADLARTKRGEKESHGKAVPGDRANREQWAGQEGWAGSLNQWLSGWAVDAPAGEWKAMLKLRSGGGAGGDRVPQGFVWVFGGFFFLGGGVLVCFETRSPWLTWNPPHPRLYISGDLLYSEVSLTLLALTIL